MEENTNYYIVDASYILNYLLPDEQSEEVMVFFQKHRARKINFISPKILFFEVGNALRYSLQRKRLDADLAHGLLNKLSILAIDIQDIDITKTFDIAVSKNISVYDASYVFLAQTNKLPLLTLDERLKKLA